MFQVEYSRQLLLSASRSRSCGNQLQTLQDLQTSFVQSTGTTQTYIEINDICFLLTFVLALVYVLFCIAIKMRLDSKGHSSLQLRPGIEQTNLHF